MKHYTPGSLGRDFVLPHARGLKGLYLDLFGVPDVRAQLSARYLLETASELKFRSVLDIGCGNGMLTCLLASRYRDCSFLGVDLLEPNATYAARLAEQSMLSNVRFKILDVECEALYGEYDLIISLAVLQFIRDPAALLKRLCNVLSPGGHLALQLPLSGGGQFLMKLRRASKRLPDFKEARGPFSAAEVECLLVESGFEEVSLRPVIKGVTTLAKEVYYLSSSVHPKALFAICPMLNWLTVFDEKYPGLASGLFVTARKSHD